MAEEALNQKQMSNIDRIQWILRLFAGQPYDGRVSKAGIVDGLKSFLHLANRAGAWPIEVLAEAIDQYIAELRAENQTVEPFLTILGQTLTAMVMRHIHIDKPEHSYRIRVSDGRWVIEKRKDSSPAWTQISSGADLAECLDLLDIPGLVTAEHELSLSVHKARSSHVLEIADKPGGEE